MAAKPDLREGQPEEIEPILEAIVQKMDSGEWKSFEDFDRSIQKLLVGTESGRNFGRASAAMQAIRFPLTPLDKAYQVHVFTWLKERDWKIHLGDHRKDEWKREQDAIDSGLEKAKKYLSSVIPEFQKKKDAPEGEKKESLSGLKEVIGIVFSQQFPTRAGIDPYSKRLGANQQRLADIVGNYYGENLYVRAHPEALDIEINNALKIQEFRDALGSFKTDRAKSLEAELSSAWPQRKNPDVHKKIAKTILNLRFEAVEERIRRREAISKWFVDVESMSSSVAVNALKMQVAEGTFPKRDWDALEKAAKNHQHLKDFGSLSMIWSVAQSIHMKKDIGTSFSLDVSAENPSKVEHPVDTNAKKKVSPPKEESPQMGLF